MNWRDRIIQRAASRPPDVIIGGASRPYLLRTFLIPRNRLFNAYVHLFLRSDDDRAHHDHPWPSLTIVLANELTEVTIAAGGIERRQILRAGDFRFRHTGRIAHRIELHNGPAWTMFLTGPRYREWGFHCPREGWIHWKRFTAEHDSGEVGKGCEG